MRHWLAKARRRLAFRPVEGDRGFALLIVLWSLVLLALMLAIVTSGGRADLARASALRDSAQSEAAAEAAVQETIWNLLDGNGDTWPIGGFHRLREAGAVVDVQIIDDRGKVDINQSPPALMTALFSVLGMDHDHATDLGQEILDWHSQGPGADNDPSVSAPYREAGLGYGPPGEQFQSLEELRLLRGMTPQIYQAAKPFLTLTLEQAPWVDFAPPEVVAAIALAGKQSKLVLDPADKRGPQVMWIIARAQGPGNARFVQRVFMRFDGTLSGPGWKYRVLGREVGEDDGR